MTTRKKAKVYLIGDSTMSKKELSAYPETGWGMPFACFFDSNLVVDNRAQNGRSTRTFIEENRWASVLDSLGEDDCVYIQFGHNDEVKTKASYTPENEYRVLLKKFVEETRLKKAYPVLLTPVTRRQFDSLGTIKETHKSYSAIVRDVANELKVPLIDLDEKSRELLNKFGSDKSILLFNNLEPGQHPNYPDGKKDNTHFNELGARMIAEIVLQETIRLKLPVISYVRKPMVKK